MTCDQDLLTLSFLRAGEGTNRAGNNNLYINNRCDAPERGKDFESRRKLEAGRADDGWLLVADDVKAENPEQEKRTRNGKPDERNLETSTVL